MGSKRRYLPKTAHPNIWLADTTLVDVTPDDHRDGDLPTTRVDEGARIGEYSLLESAGAMSKPTWATMP